MFKLIIRGLKNGFTRFLLTLLSVALGVGFLTATLTMKDSLGNLVKDILNTSYTEDLYLVGEKLTETGGYKTLPETFSKEFKHVTGVDKVIPGLSLRVSLHDSSGKTLSLQPQAPTLLIGVEEKNLTDNLKGNFPKNSSQILIEEEAAKTLNLKTGTKVKLEINNYSKEVEITGFYQTSSKYAGATLVFASTDSVKEFSHEIAYEFALKSYNTEFYRQVNLPEDSELPPALVPAYEQGKTKLREQIFAQAIQVSDIAIRIKKGSDIKQVQKLMQEKLDSTWKNYPIADKPQVLTQAEIKAEVNKTVDKQIGFINIFLLVFVAIALFVGIFVITNTFRIVVQSQTRLYAMLRAIGASGMQLFGIVSFQGILIGAVGSLLGLGLGKLFYLGIDKLLNALSMPFNVTGMSPTVITVGILVGVGVTFVASVLPARSAARIAPVEAMRLSEGANQKSGWISSILALLLGAGGVALMLSGSGDFGPTSGTRLGIGSLLVVIAVILASGRFCVPLVWVLAWPFRWLIRPGGRLALENVIRNPRRTATTASALLIGVCLVTVGAAMAGSLKSSVAGIIESEVKSPLLVADGSGQSLSESLGSKLTKVEGVEKVNDTCRFNFLNINTGKKKNDSITTFSCSPRAIQENFSIEAKTGKLEDFFNQPTTISKDTPVPVIFKESYASTLGAKVGDIYELRGDRNSAKVKVVATFNWQLSNASILTSDRLTDYLYPTIQSNPTITIWVKPGEKVDTVKQRIEKLMKTENGDVYTKEEYVGAISKQVNQMLAIVYGLLALSILIAILGVVNSQSLSLYERLREIGMLQALGLSRSRIGMMVTIESILISIFATVVGIILGLGLSWELYTYLYNVDSGMTKFDLPFSQLLWLLGCGILVGIIASIMPVFRAVRLNMLQVISQNE